MSVFSLSDVNNW